MILATGTSGTIGRHLSADVAPIQVDLSLPNSVAEIDFPLNSTIVHLAGIVGPAQVLIDPNYAYKVNVLGSIRLAEKCLQSEGSRLIFISTSHVYMSSKERIREDFELDPGNIYAEQKLEAEIKLKDIFSSDYGRLCILRLFSILDWDVHEYTLGGIVKKIRSGNQNTPIVNSEDVRDFLTPRKAGRTISRIAKFGLSGTFNLCTGNGIKVGDAVRRMLALDGIEINSEVMDKKNSKVPTLVGDPSKLQSHIEGLNLIWKPSIPPESK